MPRCACFHSYELTAVGSGEFKLTVSIEGYGDLRDILRNSELATSVSVSPGWFDQEYSLSGVRSEEGLRNFLDLLRSCIVVDLAPAVDECYALGPYTVFREDIPVRAMAGELLNQAKYRQNMTVTSGLGEVLNDFIGRHPRFGTLQAIATPPKRDQTTPDVAGQCAQAIADNRGWVFVKATTTRESVPQKALNEEETEDDLRARIANSTKVVETLSGPSALILDDTIRSGGTMVDLARSLREAGASQVFGLAVAKDAKYTLGGIDLSWERWQ